MMQAFPFAACVPFGRERTGVLFRAAGHEVAPEALLVQIENVLGLSACSVLRFADKRRGQRCSMRVVPAGDGTRLDGFMRAGDISAEAWVKPLLHDELPAKACGRRLLVPGAKAPVAAAARGKQVCSCFDVSDGQIKAVLGDCTSTPDARLLQLQDRSKCGSNCGSCVSKLRRLVRASQQAARFAPAPRAGAEQASVAARGRGPENCG
jgi:assimilatory nitrate reductase catalytic subunit